MKLPLQGYKEEESYLMLVFKSYKLVEGTQFYEVLKSMIFSLQFCTASAKHAARENARWNLLFPTACAKMFKIPQVARWCGEIEAGA